MGSQQQDRHGKDTARAQRYPCTVKHRVTLEKDKNPDETKQGGRRWMGKELKQKEHSASRGSHSWLQFGEQPLPHLVCPERASAARVQPPHSKRCCLQNSVTSKPDRIHPQTKQKQYLFKDIYFYAEEICLLKRRLLPLLLASC